MADKIFDFKDMKTGYIDSSVLNKDDEAHLAMFAKTLTRDGDTTLCGHLVDMAAEWTDASDDNVYPEMPENLKAILKQAAGEGYEYVVFQNIH